MSPTPVCHFDRLQNNYVSWQPSHNLPSEIQENHAQHHGTGEQRGYEYIIFTMEGKKNSKFRQIPLFMLCSQSQRQEETSKI